MKTHPVQDALEAAGATQAELAAFLDVDPSTLSNKLQGRRRWTQEEINTALAFFRQREHAVTYDELFGEQCESLPPTDEPETEPERETA